MGMSQENVEIVRRGYEALVRRDTEAIDRLMREHMAPDFEFESAVTGEIYKGAQGAWDLAADLWETLDYRPAIEEVIDLGENVVVIQRFSGRGRLSGVSVTQQIAVVWRVEEKRIVRAKSFTSRAEALEAAGLSE
jgi:ketosteroid isomerase-like protein